MDSEKVIKTFCPYCGFKHNVQIVPVVEESIFDGMYVEYTAEYCYCEEEKSYFESSMQEIYNYILAQNAYREKRWEVSGGPLKGSSKRKSNQ